jgi:DNA topoisomerase-1
VDLNDRRLAAIVKACRDLPGYELFQYVDDDGTRQAIDSSDVNAYLREICGDDFTAKDFRTWSGTVLAARALAGAAGFTSQRDARRKVGNAIESVARSLGNTKTVCRKSYVHPAVIDAYMDGATIRVGQARALRAVATTGLSAEERAVVALVSARLRRKTA